MQPQSDRRCLWKDMPVSPIWTRKKPSPLGSEQRARAAVRAVRFDSPAVCWLRRQQQRRCFEPSSRQSEECLKGWISIPISEESPEFPAWFPVPLAASAAAGLKQTAYVSLCEPGQLEVDLFSVDFMAALLLQATALV